MRQHRGEANLEIYLQSVSPFLCLGHSAVDICVDSGSRCSDERGPGKWGFDHGKSLATLQERKEHRTD